MAKSELISNSWTSTQGVGGVLQRFSRLWWRAPSRWFLEPSVRVPVSSPQLCTADSSASNTNIGFSLRSPLNKVIGNLVT